LAQLRNFGGGGLNPPNSPFGTPLYRRGVDDGTVGDSLCSFLKCAVYSGPSRWDQMSVYRSGIEPSGSSLTAQHNSHCFNYTDNKIIVHIPFALPEANCGSGDIDPHIHTVSTRRMLIVSLTPSHCTVGKTKT
jgi:hypothetical protein